MSDSRLADAAATSRSDGPAVYRLVIRAEIIPEQTSLPVEPKLSSRAVALGVSCAALLVAIGWAAMNFFGADTPVALDRSTQPQTPVIEQSESPAMDSSQLASSPAPSPVVKAPMQAAAPKVEPSSPAKSSIAIAPTSPTHEVIPEPPRSALQTIRGTVRVSVRLTLDARGAVIDAKSENPGPSRYFERLSLQAARQWKFTPTTSSDARTALVQFNFTRNDVTANVERMQ